MGANDRLLQRLTNVRQTNLATLALDLLTTAGVAVARFVRPDAKIS
jgi:hypothetical protein